MAWKSYCYKMCSFGMKSAKAMVFLIRRHIALDKADTLFDTTGSKDFSPVHNFVA